jgi:phosphoribosylaminoimidazolecarboxamide formyltransferase/IMP cyclohydrolase
MALSHAAIVGVRRDAVPMRTALLSVSDKTGLVELATALVAAGCQLVSTGGTASALRAAGLAVRDVSEITNFPEILNGRVKTLHPAVHGALLAVRGNDEHAKQLASHSIHEIDCVVCNLYAFEATVAKGSDFDTCIENIDIGGPSMIRSAAKNHASVAVVTDPSQYAEVCAELAAHSGCVSLSLRRRLAAAAFAKTAAYDAAIAAWMASAI